MGIGYIAGNGSGGGGVLSSDVTAKRENVLKGTTTITSDSADAVVEGTMPNNDAVDVSLPVNGSYTIPKGYHNGNGKVKQSLTTLKATNYYAQTKDQVIAGGRYISGNQWMQSVSQSGLAAGNIRSGVNIKVGNGKTNLFDVTGTAQEFKHAYGLVTSGTEQIRYSKYKIAFTLPFTPVTGYAVAISGTNRDICIVDPNTGGGHHADMVVFDQSKLNSYNSVAYADGEYGLSCFSPQMVLPVTFRNTVYAYFFAGHT
jgi:hypothetical protein